jgi:hypothetical protein
VFGILLKSLFFEGFKGIKSIIEESGEWREEREYRRG